MRNIKIKILEGGCNSDPCAAAAPLPAERHMAKIMARDKHMHTSDCEKPSGYKNAHNGEEARMHRTTLAHLIADVKVLLDLVQDGDDLPEWLETKITKAGDYMSSAARYIAGNIARDQGQLGRSKKLWLRKNPCETYGTLEEQIMAVQEQSELGLLRALIAQAAEDIDDLSDEEIESMISALNPIVNAALSEGIVGLTEEILIEEQFVLYENLQDAIDENGEHPCPQCLYEVLSEASVAAQTLFQKQSIEVEM